MHVCDEIYSAPLHSQPDPVAYAVSIENELNDVEIINGLTVDRLHCIARMDVARRVFDPMLDDQSVATGFDGNSQSCFQRDLVDADRADDHNQCIEPEESSNPGRSRVGMFGTIAFIAVT